jgi:leader peptidase (prepilin peptidase)/N-methyltransferase
MKVGALLTKREAMGLGDVFLLPGLAAFLGAGAIVPVVLLASLQGSAYGLALVALGRSEPGPEAGEPPAEGAAEAEPPPATEAEGVGDGAAPRAEPSPGAEAAPEVEPDWVPPRHAVPFGPFLVAGALEWLYLADWLTAHVPVLGAFR